MNSGNSDLEEGEILDSPPSPNIIPVAKKKKVLPKRYVIRDKTNHKHKKDCKYATHHPVLKPSKLKKSPSRAKTPHKQIHKPICSHQKAIKLPKTFKSVGCSKHKLSKNDKSLPQLSLIAEMKSTFKDIDIKLSSKLHNKSESEKNQKETLTKNYKRNESQHSKNQLNTSTNDEDIFIISDSRQNNSNSKLCNQPVIEEEKDQSTPLKLEPHNNSENVPHDLNSNDSLENKNEESEDEEELRRIALATFAKRKIQDSDTIPNASVPVFSSSNDDDDDVQIIHETDNLEMDNYEIVDMEVDEDVQDSVDLIQAPAPVRSEESSENLFVIDTNPSVDLLGNKENAPSESQAASDGEEEFALDMLRAELIKNMAHKKFPPENPKKEEKRVHVDRSQPSSPVIPKQNSYLNYRKPHTFYQRKPLQSVKRTLRGNVNKSRNLKHHIKHNTHFQINKPVVLPPVEVKKPPERLVIALNDESSSDESDHSEDNDAGPDNPVESIVALISDCRQKSSENSADKAKEVGNVPKPKEVINNVPKPKEVINNVPKAKEVVVDVPKAVSCLSKAQQEEYNTLKKILAEKKKVPPTQESVSPKNGSVHSPLDDLKVLEGKLTGLKDKLKSKKEYLTSITKDEKAKQKQYMKAKLSAQHLKEQFIAAEKIRKAKLLEWSEACNNLKAVNKSVSILEEKIGQVQNLCTKIGLSINGKSYNLPLSPSTKQQPS